MEALCWRGPPRATVAPRETTASPPATALVTSVSVGEGAVLHDGVARTGLNLEPAIALERAWAAPQLSAVVGLERPHAVVVRAGVKLDLGPVLARPGVQMLVNPVTTWGVVLGLGRELEVSEHWRMLAEVDAALWPAAATVVPIEARLGVARVF